MMQKNIVCENCGTVCNADDGYCKNCWKKLIDETDGDDAIIEGIGRSTWTNFIEKNSSYYMPIFEKHEGKRFFVHMNWSAFFFGFYWMFYRKMYKTAAILYAVFAVVTLLITSLIALPYAAELKELKIPIDYYEHYLAEGGESILYDANGEPYAPPIAQHAHEAENRIEKIRLSITVTATLIVTALHPLVFGLFGNALYKAYVKKNIYEPRKGGASATSMVFGVIAVNAIESAFTYGATIVMVFLLSLQ